MEEKTVSMSAAIDGLEWSRGFSNAAQALALAASEFETYFRPTAKQILVLVTDGSVPSVFKKGVKDAAAKLRDMGVRLVIVAVNGQTASCVTDLAEMSAWVGENDVDKNLIRLTGYPQLTKKYADNVMLHVCDEVDLSLFSKDDVSKLLEPDPIVASILKGGDPSP